MKHEDPFFETQEREALQETQAPDGLWEKIEAQAQLRLNRPGTRVQNESGTLGGWERFGKPLRFAAAGILGFVGFFGLQMALVPDAVSVGKRSLSAGGPLVVEQIRDGIPLMGNSADYVDSMQKHRPWPEIALATSFVTAESN
ncbi:MAG: hypothetical protein ACYSU1_06670 [Planctomycetota bacterium]|jgi:hypothetical protein